MTIYGYRIYASKNYNSHVNGVYSSTGYTSNEEAATAMHKVIEHINDSEDIFVNDYELFEYVNTPD